MKDPAGDVKLRVVHEPIHAKCFTFAHGVLAAVQRRRTRSLSQGQRKCGEGLLNRSVMKTAYKACAMREE